MDEPQEAGASAGRGWLTVLAGSLSALIVMSLDRRLDGVGVLLGSVSLLVASWGALDAAGAFDQAKPKPPFSPFLPAGGERPGERRLWRPAASLVGMLLLTLGVLRSAVRGAFPLWLSAVLVPVVFLGLVVACFQSGAALGFCTTRPLLRRHGFWLVAIALLLLLPTAGSHSLIDPWETHYGEVAREILARNDWLSLWWAQDGWFFSKPVGNFWLQALAMAALGVDYRADQMLAADDAGRLPWPEWAVRTPIALLAILGLYLLYKGVAKAAGRRAGFFGALVLMTMPQWSLLARQTMTDMPFVACLTAAMGLLLWGFHTDPEEPVRTCEAQAFGVVWRLNAQLLVAGTVTFLVLAQGIYLLSRNVDLLTQPNLAGSPVSPVGGPVSPVGYGFRWHFDQFLAGSIGNCTLPGNEPCRRYAPTILWLQPGLQALLWLATLPVLLRRLVREERAQRVAFLGASLFMALATLFKGPAGLLLPGLCVLLFVAITGRWRERTRLEWLTGALLFIVVTAPWFVAMYARHGFPFVERFFFHDLWKRAVGHVHDTNEGDDVSSRYYLWQLGYAVFPWVGLLPAALVRWARRDDEIDQGDPTSTWLVLWFVVVFALFSAMQTKFHHYIFPALPPAAMLIGIELHRLLPAPLFRRLNPATSPTPPDALSLSCALFAGAGLVGLVGRDLVVHPPGEFPGQARLLHLFTYVYRRPWPLALDFSRTLLAFTVVAALLTFLLGVPRWRKVAGVSLMVLALLFTSWELNRYLVATSPHWGQRETIAAYYHYRREGEILVAYRMNWKGENFYTGNHVAVFADGGDLFKNWLREQSQQGQRTLFVMTEHHLVPRLHTDLGTLAHAEPLTTRELNNKFLLFRVSLLATR